MKENIGIGIIGTGFGRKVQIPAFLACDRVAIASVASGRLENARETADECGALHYTDDWRETVRHPEVDLVCITTPPVFHHEMVLLALEQEKHVLCEKPMAMNLGEAQEIAEAAKSVNVLTLIDHELRFQHGRQTAYAMLRMGDIGKVKHVKYIFQAPHRGDPDLPWNWWSDITQGGGALGAINSHIIDSFHWMLDTDVSEVFCQLQTNVMTRRDRDGEMRPVTTDDQANMILRFADSEVTQDATGLVSVSMTEGPEYTNRIEFYGEHGAIRVGPRGNVYVTNKEEKSWDEIEVDLGTMIEGVPDTGFSRGFMALAPKIVDAIRDGQNEIEYAATFADGVKVQRVLDAARESNADGRVVKL